MVTNQVTFYGIAEVEASYSNRTDWEKHSNSDLVVAAVELGGTAQIIDSISTSISFLYEEDDTPLEVDQATIDFTNIGGIDLVASLGQTYVPFGAYNTYLVNDTLILELAETRETAAIMGWNVGDFSLAGYVFNGDIDNGHDTLENFGLSANHGSGPLNVGIDYISNILDSDGITGALEDTAGGDVSSKKFAGFTAHADLTLGDFVLIGEYFQTEKIRADDVLDSSGTPFLADNISAKALQLEGAFNVDNNSFSVAYQTTDDAVELGLPEQRLSIGASRSFNDNVSASLEFWRDEDYSQSKDGTGRKADSIVAQVAVSF